MNLRSTKLDSRFVRTVADTSGIVGYSYDNCLTEHAQALTSQVWFLLEFFLGGGCFSLHCESYVFSCIFMY